MKAVHVHERVNVNVDVDGFLQLIIVERRIIFHTVQKNDAGND